jgi:hypothetical protein
METTLETYLLGPFISVLPRRWRESLFSFVLSQWRTAAEISGIAESLGALVALSYWYMHAMTAWAGNAVASALIGKLGPGVTTEAIGTVAFSVWVTHPLTLLLAYAGIEGAFRFCAAAFSDQILGTLPLFLLDKAVRACFRGRRHQGAGANAPSEGNLSSAIGAVRERVMVARLPAVADELWFRKSDSDEILKIRSSRRKDDWTPPKVVRHQDVYYRLESVSMATAPRPFQYVLRRLPAGVPGRTVLLYSPTNAVINEIDREQ